MKADVIFFFSRRVEDVYVLPAAPKLEDCLSALVGIPMTRQVHSNQIGVLIVSKQMPFTGQAIL